MLRASRGFTLIELLMVIALIGIIAATAIPILMRARVSSNEASAIASMRAITSAQTDFEALTRGFADDLATLAGTCPGGMVPFVSPDLGANNVMKSGYRFALAPGAAAVAGPVDCFGNPSQSAYYASAFPVSIGITGARGFATNVAATLWQDTAGAAPVEPFVIAGTVSPLGK
jgi:prepilin-type N-terminal cleavage/methylation domain-containing protein